MTIFDNLKQTLSGLFNPREKLLFLTEDQVLEMDQGYIYNDMNKQYYPLRSELCRSVSDIESLASVINMEANRRVTKGDFMTVFLTRAGGVFHADDKLRKNQYLFNRRLSTQWKQLIEALKRLNLGHNAFLLSLQQLRPSIVNYSDVNKAFTTLKFINNLVINSSPLMIDGKMGESAVLEYTLSNGRENSNIEIPTTIEFLLPYSISDTEEEYLSVPAEILVSVNEESKKPMFTLIAPTIELIEEKAIKREAEKFSKLLEKYGVTEIYVHNDY